MKTCKNCSANLTGLGRIAGQMVCPYCGQDQEIKGGH